MSLSGQVGQQWQVYFNPMAANTRASVTKTATANSIHVVTYLVAAIYDTTNVGIAEIRLFLGGTYIFSKNMAVPRYTNDQQNNFVMTGLNIAATENQLIKFEFVSVGTTQFQSVAMGGYTIT